VFNSSRASRRGDGNGNRKKSFNVSEFQGFKDLEMLGL
jgi:hypothetical protein